MNRLSSFVALGIVMSACSSSSTSGGGDPDSGRVTCATSKCSDASDGQDGDPGVVVDSGGPTTVSFSCTQGSGTVTMCTQTRVDSSSLPPLQQSCSDQGGSPGTACSPSGLVGCCKYPDGTEACAYDPSQLANDQASCSGVSGSWSSTP
jgi:hypothetical protein